MVLPKPGLTTLRLDDLSRLMMGKGVGLTVAVGLGVAVRVRVAVALGDAVSEGLALGVAVRV